MAISKKSIEELTFTTKKGKYYVGEEVDRALDSIAEEVEAMQAEMAQLRSQSLTHSSGSNMEQFVRGQLGAVIADLSQQILEKNRKLQELEKQITDLETRKNTLEDEITSRKNEMRNQIRNAVSALTEIDSSLISDESSPSEPHEDESAPIPSDGAETIAQMDIWEK